MNIVRTAGAVALIILCATMPQGRAQVVRIVPGNDVTPPAVGQVVVADLNHYAPSPPLEEIAVVKQRQEEEADLAKPLSAASRSAAGDDPVAQTSAGQPVDTVDLGSFNGLGHTGSAPSDANGAAGSTQYVQWVNSKNWRIQ